MFRMRGEAKRMHQQPNAPQAIAGVLDSGLRLFKASFSRTVGLAAIFALPLALTNLPGLVARAGGLPQQGDSDAALWFSIALAAPFAGMFIVLGEILVLAAQMHAVAMGQPLGFGAALARGLRRLPAALAFALLYAAPILLGFAALQIARPVSPLLDISFLVLALLFASVFLVYWYFAPLLIVVEGSGPLRAMKRSLHLVRSHWWRTAVIITVASLIWFGLGGMATLLSIAMEVSEDGFMLVLTLALVALDFLAQGLGGMIMVGVSLALLHDLRLRRSGADLAERADALQ